MQGIPNLKLFKSAGNKPVAIMSGEAEPFAKLKAKVEKELTSVKRKGAYYLKEEL